MRARQCGSVFDLLVAEKERAIELYRSQHQPLQNNEGPSESNYASDQGEPSPLLTWKLANLNLKQNFFRESDIFGGSAADNIDPTELLEGL